MKRRAQLPNAQTYTILFDGFAASEHPKLAVAEATRIYTSMLHGRLPPNTIHMNAVLKVCARARDLESMFNIVGTVNGTTRAPDQHTYTTVLNALPLMPAEAPKSQAEKTLRDSQVSTAIGRAKAIWEEVVSKWQNGLIVVDEHLVCAMAKVLAAGTRPNSREILALVEQTMGIPRLDRQAPAKQPKDVDGKATEATEADEDGGDDGGCGPEFAVAPTTKPGIFARPGVHTLSAVLKALRRIKRPDLAMAYWEAFSTRGVVPDANNWFWVLLILRGGRDTGSTVKMLQKMPPQLMLPKTFQFAMQTCLDCAADHDTFGHAGQILDLMSQNLRIPDPFTMRIYLSVAEKSTRPFARQASDGDPEGAKFAQGRQLLRAMDRMWEPLRLLTNATQYPPVDARQHAAQLYNEEREAHAVARMMVGLADRVVTEAMASEDVLKVTRLRRDQLNRQVKRFWQERESREPNLAREKRTDKRGGLVLETRRGKANILGAGPLLPGPPRARGDEFTSDSTSRPAGGRGRQTHHLQRRQGATTPTLEEDGTEDLSARSSSREEPASRRGDKVRNQETEDNAFARAFSSARTTM